MCKKILFNMFIIILVLSVICISATSAQATTLSEDPWSAASTWAEPELSKAATLKLIPETLLGADMTLPINRAEFAAVAVKVYENISGTTTEAPKNNPFNDTNDMEVLKALQSGIMVGVSDNAFDPATILNREQMATALTRVLKRSYIPDWSFATDNNYTLSFTMPAKFADDSKISEWAKPSVYFMAAHSIINGTGNNLFSPQAEANNEQLSKIATATREQALAIGVRLVEKLKGKTLDYQKNGSTTEETTGDATDEATDSANSTITDQETADTTGKTIDDKSNDASDNTDDENSITIVINSPIIGKWEILNSNGQMTYEFKANGNLTIEAFKMLTNGTFRVEGNKITMTYSENSVVFNFNITGRTLTLTDNTGKKITLTRI